MSFAAAYFVKRGKKAPVVCLLTSRGDKREQGESSDKAGGVTVIFKPDFKTINCLNKNVMNYT